MKTLSLGLFCVALAGCGATSPNSPSQTASLSLSQTAVVVPRATTAQIAATVTDAAGLQDVTSQAELVTDPTSTVRIVDRDTEEELAAIALPSQEVFTTSQASIAWTIDVALFR